MMDRPRAAGYLFQSRARVLGEATRHDYIWLVPVILLASTMVE